MMLCIKQQLWKIAYSSVKKLFQIQQIFIANIAVIQSWRRWIRFHQNNIGQAKDDQDQRLRGHLEFLQTVFQSSHWWCRLLHFYLYQSWILENNEFVFQKKNFNLFSIFHILFRRPERQLNSNFSSAERADLGGSC